MPEPVHSRPIFTTVPLSRILAGQRHAPVVYFAHMGFIQGGVVVKIGTSANLRCRMRDLYVPLERVLAVVPGDREIEAGYHRLFAEYQVSHKQRELFRMEGRLECFLNSQAEGAYNDLPPCEPTLIQSAPAHSEPVTPVSEDSRGVLVSITEAAVRGFAPGATKGSLHMDRYRSDRGQLPGGLKFPEPVVVHGRKELFWSTEIAAFNETRRGRKVA